MRFWEILDAIYKNKSKPLVEALSREELHNDDDYELGAERITLRHIHNLRKSKDHADKEKKKHLEFLPTMYSNQSALSSEQMVELEIAKLNNATDLEIERMKIQAGK